MLKYMLKERSEERPKDSIEERPEEMSKYRQKERAEERNFVLILFIVLKRVRREVGKHIANPEGGFWTPENEFSMDGLNFGVVFDKITREPTNRFSLETIFSDGFS